MLPQNSAYLALTAPGLLTDILRTLTTAGGAQKFPFAASARIIFSRLKSATARRSLAFSFSSSFNALIKNQITLFCFGNLESIFSSNIKIGMMFFDSEIALISQLLS